MTRRILVTGGAGLIGSYTVDALINEGHEVRILDCLEHPTHLNGEPPSWLNPKAEFVLGDVRRIEDLRAALDGIDGVIHLAATGGFTPDISRYIETNSLGTARLLEAIEERGDQVRRVVVASSVGVYGEGSYVHPDAPTTWQKGTMRDVARMEQGAFEVHCEASGVDLSHCPIPETTPKTPLTPYCVSKLDQELLVMNYGRQRGLETVALRYFLTYGPRQSRTNPYTGVIAIFVTRARAGQPIVVFEDGAQERDFIHAQDVAQANLVALTHPDAPGQVFNVGTGKGTSIATVAKQIYRKLSPNGPRPRTDGSFRPGDARHLVADSSALQALGWRPKIPFKRGLNETLDWMVERDRVEDRLDEAIDGLRDRRIVQGGKGSTPTAKAEITHTLSVVVPAYDEAGNIERMVSDCLTHLPTFTTRFEVIVVNDGSRDGTREVVESLARRDSRVRPLHHPFNMGYGAAQKSGFEAARYDWVALVPADNQFDIRDLRRYLALSDDADIIGGVRIDRKEAADRRWVSDLYNRYIRSRYGIALSDLNWVKMYRGELLRQIEVETPGFSADAEVVIKLMKLGARVKELEVEHYPRTWGDETHVSLKNLATTAQELWTLSDKLRDV